MRRYDYKNHALELKGSRGTVYTDDRLLFRGDGYNPNSKLNPESTKTITELAYIPNTVKDGFYFVNIQIPHFVCDAAPSRPLLCKTM